jgi:aconitate hydratase
MIQKKELPLTGSQKKYFYDLSGLGDLSRLPVSIRIVLESLARNCDGVRVEERHVKSLASWKPNAERTDEIPFVVGRVLLQDFTGVPLGVDLAAMRSAVAKLGKDPALIEPLVPVDLVIDHSVQVDFAGKADSFQRNLELEFDRNKERYQFLKWCANTFKGFSVVPPGIGICHQVNLEYLANGVLEQNGVVYPDTLVGTDSHTTMINGLGVVGWGVGGIEAEAAMLGQPVYFLTPDVVGVNLYGSLKPGVTATDLVLTITEMLRKAKVVGKFVEFFGEGTQSLSVTDRATIANMAPEYGATMGFFPVDERCCDYLKATGRTEAAVELFRTYYKAQGLFGIPKKGEIDYSEELTLDLSTVIPSAAGPKRPQDRVTLPEIKGKVAELVTTEAKGPGLKHGDVVIAAITSCTNTSNPSVMIASGLVAKKAVERGLKLPSHVKASLAPGSRVVSAYLRQGGLQDYLDQLGFNLVGYGCTTCIGNSGPLPDVIEKEIADKSLVVASVLSGNRNFEARVHSSVKANFLMSPPLVVAFALAGTVDINLESDPIGNDSSGNPVYLKDLWPSLDEINALMPGAFDPDLYRDLYSDFVKDNKLWQSIPSEEGAVYNWQSSSTYIQEPPYFADFDLTPRAVAPIKGARALAIFGDSITTDHISPAGAIKASSPAGRFLQSRQVEVKDFNSYGARRGNHEVMIRGTFANVRIKNLMLDGVEGGMTKHQPSGELMDIYSASERYLATGTPLIVVAGQEYGTGSSRDWAAKGTALLGVKAVIAQSFERIHRSNLVGMGVLPCQFEAGVNAQTLGLKGDEEFELAGYEQGIKPQMMLELRVKRPGGEELKVPVRLRVDTPIEVEYYRHGGILPYVLRQILRS